MATYSVQSAKHATLVAATVDSVTLAASGRYFQVIHRGAITNPLYVTAGKAPTDPTSAGDNTIAVPGGTSLVLPWPVDTAGGGAIVKVICASAEPYTVQVLGDRLS